MDRRSLVDYIPWGCKRVSHDLRNKQQQQTQTHSNQEELLGEPGNWLKKKKKRVPNKSVIESQAKL